MRIQQRAHGFRGRVDLAAPCGIVSKRRTATEPGDPDGTVTHRETPRRFEPDKLMCVSILAYMAFYLPATFYRILLDSKMRSSSVRSSRRNAPGLEQPQELRKPVPASDRDLARIAASYRGSARSRGCTYC